MELGGTGVDTLKGWGDGLGWVWPEMRFLDQGRSSLLSLHWFYMQKRRNGHLANEIAWEWIEMVICCFGKITLRAGQNVLEQPQCTSPVLKASENESKVHHPQGGCQLWHFSPGIDCCRVEPFVLFFCRRVGTMLLLIIMQHFYQRLDWDAFILTKDLRCILVLLNKEWQIIIFTLSYLNIPPFEEGS